MEHRILLKFVRGDLIKELVGGGVGGSTLGEHLLASQQYSHSDEAPSCVHTEGEMNRNLHASSTARTGTATRAGTSLSILSISRVLALAKVASEFLLLL